MIIGNGIDYIRQQAGISYFTLCLQNYLATNENMISRYITGPLSGPTFCWIWRTHTIMDARSGQANFPATSSPKIKITKNKLGFLMTIDQSIDNSLLRIHKNFSPIGTKKAEQAEIQECAAFFGHNLAKYEYLLIKQAPYVFIIKLHVLCNI